MLRNVEPRLFYTRDYCSARRQSAISQDKFLTVPKRVRLTLFLLLIRYLLFVGLCCYAVCHLQNKAVAQGADEEHSTTTECGKIGI